MSIKKERVAKFLIYLFRWILSGLFMSIPLYFLRNAGMMNPYINLIIISIIGAIVFWKIDKKIFKNT